ncbi:glycosyltransferase involved in cell wall biosynthesis [Duganella sp. 1411]|uniref:glycosyltransferase family 4 protein n=1 Tax=Duganella sp. 1411 TaxID=2806572 RepID=UPI001AE8C140|nr:glycosyltransferase family 4 protein [Duganella sp. 1411]MBP1205696.1 glycosyltransferase involved in cell wall biosynthesis [Duganella sp. 1411]
MKIAYIRNTFPKPTETFILEEILYLKRAGHEVRIISNWSDLSNLNGKIIDEGLLGNVVCFGLKKIALSEQLNIALRFLWASRGKHYRNFFWFNFIKDRDVDAELKRIFTKKFSGLSFFEKTKKQVAERWEIFIDGIRKNNISVSKSEYVLKYQTFSPDHIHCPFLFAWDVDALAQLHAALPRVPYTVTLRSRDIYLEKADPRYLSRRNKIIREASKIFTISEFNKKTLSSMFSFQGEMQVVHSSIDALLFTVDPAIVVKENQLICVARLVPKKGLEVLIEACALLRASGQPFQLSIVGGGVLRSVLLQQIESAGLSDVVHIVGPFRHKVIKDMLNESEIFVLPCVVASDGDRDILPNSLKEAMAMERLVVTSDVSGIDELVCDGIDGLLVAPNDPVALAEKIRFGLRNKEFARIAGRKARNKILQGFDINGEGRKFEQEISRLVSHAAPAIHSHA